MGMFKDWFERNICAPGLWCGICQRPEEDCECERIYSAAYSRAYEQTKPKFLKPGVNNVKPKLVHVTRAPARDEWHAWRESPVTEFIMAALRGLADEHAQQWHQVSWLGGEADQRTLDVLRERADALRGIAEADYEAFCETLGLEPEAIDNAA